MKADSPSAAVLVIGNEILSGRIPDANLNYIAKRLGELGVFLQEARVVPDIEAEIVEAVNALRARYTYVFTTGGIGPTHDDITVEAVAAAFKLPVIEHPGARELLKSFFGESLTPARLRMARTPQGADLIKNPVSCVPGIKIENVYMLAGVPEIMRGMMDSVLPDLRRGPEVFSSTISGYIAESVLAEDLRALAGRLSDVDIGSYLWMKDGKIGTSLVVRGVDEKAVDRAAVELKTLMKKYGTEPFSEN